MHVLGAQECGTSPRWPWLELALQTIHFSFHVHGRCFICLKMGSRPKTEAMLSVGTMCVGRGHPWEFPMGGELATVKSLWQSRMTVRQPPYRLDY